MCPGLKHFRAFKSRRLCSYSKASTGRLRSRIGRRPRARTRTSRGMKRRTWRWRIFRIRTFKSWIAVCTANSMVSAGCSIRYGRQTDHQSGELIENGEPFPPYDVPHLQSQSLTSQEDAVRAAHQAVAAQRISGRATKSSKGKWHFGIRSRSPPIEVMHEIYNTLQVLGMQWKRKQCFDGPWDQDGRPIRETPPGMTREQRQKEKINEEKQNQSLFFVETRCKIDNVVVSRPGRVC